MKLKNILQRRFNDKEKNPKDVAIPKIEGNRLAYCVFKKWYIYKLQKICFKNKT